MLENQFIKTDGQRVDASRKPTILPTWAHDYNPGLSGYLEIYIHGLTDEIAVIKPWGTVVYSKSLEPSSDAFKIVSLQGLFYEANNTTPLEEGEQYFIRIRRGQSIYRYSNPIIFSHDADEFSVLRYRCYEEAFGFPFDGTKYVSIYLPIRIHSPQNVQDDKTYVKADGSVVTLYAKYYKEWEGETEYLSEEMHDKIVAALSCDEVYINGRRVTKTDKYQIKWENYYFDCDGETKLAKATFKVRANITQRNSNY